MEQCDLNLTDWRYMPLASWCEQDDEHCVFTEGGNSWPAAATTCAKEGL